jgi:PD-(D/E)XK endonuclease
VAERKRKGNFAELKVATDLAARGCELSIPFGENCSYDLIADYEGRLHRVQVKSAKSDGRVVCVKCYSHSLTGGKVRSTKHYTAAMVDWVVVYDLTTDSCYYIPSWILGAEGRSQLMLRLTPTLNGQSLRIRPAEDYVDPDFSRDPSMEPAGIEPATSRMQTGRSAS